MVCSYESILMASCIEKIGYILEERSWSLACFSSYSHIGFETNCQEDAYY